MVIEKKIKKHILRIKYETPYGDGEDILLEKPKTITEDEVKKAIDSWKSDNPDAMIIYSEKVVRNCYLRLTEQDLFMMV